MNKDFQYDRINGGIKIFKYIGAAESLEIPAQIDNLPVVEIGSKAFSDCKNLKSVEVPDSVKIIAEDAFHGCDNLIVNISAEFKFGNIFLQPKFMQTFIPTLTPTNSRSFKYTKLGDSIRIDKYKGKKTSVVIPSLIENLPVTKIGKNAFQDCTNLKEIHISDSVTEIGNEAFRDCVSLREIHIPNSVTRIGYWAFFGCRSLAEIKIPDSITKIGESTFWNCSGLTEITIPNSVKEICKNAFWNCNSLRFVSLPAGIKVDKDAFKNCPAEIIYRDKK